MAARNNPTTDWRTKANETAKHIENEVQKERAALKEEENLIKRLSEEQSIALEEIGPKVKEVCAYFAKSNKGSLSREKRNNMSYPFNECKYSKKYYTHRSQVDLLRFIVTGPKPLEGRIRILLYPGGITFETSYFTEKFLSKCTPKSEDAPKPSLEFYSERRVDEHMKYYWEAYYYLPYEKFTQEKLAEILAVFILETFDGKAAIQLDR